jgi:hypothetical protein
MLATPVPTKQCKGPCGQVKPLDQFHRRARSRDGLQAHCRACGRAALDAADARRKAAAQPHQPLARDFDELVDLLAARALDVAVALWEAAEAGEDVLAHLADALEPHCPSEAGSEGGDPDLWCELHEIACAHLNARFDRGEIDPLTGPVPGA